MWLDALRGIGILLVLLAHNNPPFIRFIFGFHMPLFYALSGYLFKETTINRKPFEQIKRLLMQYIVLCLAVKSLERDGPVQDRGVDEALLNGQLHEAG